MTITTAPQVVTQREEDALSTTQLGDFHFCPVTDLPEAPPETEPDTAPPGTEPDTDPITPIRQPRPARPAPGPDTDPDETPDTVPGPCRF